MRTSVLMAAMDPIAETRHRNLLALIEEAGSAAELSRRTSVPASYISQLRNKVKTAGGVERGIGPETARMLEKGMGKPTGWMDESELAPKERELLQWFRQLSGTGQGYIVDRVKSLASAEGQDDSIS